METTAAIFRPATPRDQDCLLAMMRDFYAHERLEFDPGAASSALGQILGNADLGRVWLIETAGEIAGYVVLAFGFSLEHRGRDAFIDELFVGENFRGRGLGRQAMEFLESACRELGVRALHLEVERDNAPAQELYRKSGFRDNGRFLLSKKI